MNDGETDVRRGLGAIEHTMAHQLRGKAAEVGRKPHNRRAGLLLFCKSSDQVSVQADHAEFAAAYLDGSDQFPAVTVFDVRIDRRRVQLATPRASACIKKGMQAMAVAAFDLCKRPRRAHRSHRGPRVPKASAVR
jgi:hypothetical protein